MEEILTRMLENVLGRLDGPLHLRFIIQPLVAAIFAVIDGVEDAKQGEPVYFLGLFGSVAERRRLLNHGWNHFGRLFIVAITLDVVYQLIVTGWVYPLETIVVACLLSIFPYVLLRGPINRLMRFVKKF